MRYRVQRDAQGNVRGFGPVEHWLPGEQPGCTVSIEAVCPTLPAQTDVRGLKAWLKANMTFVLRNNVAKAYPNFLVDLNSQEWDDFQVGCEIAKAAVPLTAGQWTAFKNACTTYSIPVTLS